MARILEQTFYRDPYQDVVVGLTKVRIENATLDTFTVPPVIDRQAFVVDSLTNTAFARAKAEITVEAATSPVAGETFIVNGITYTFSAAPAAAYEVGLDANEVTMATYLIAIINGDTSNAAIAYTGTRPNPGVVASAGSTTAKVLLTALGPSPISWIFGTATAWATPAAVTGTTEKKGNALTEPYVYYVTAGPSLIDVTDSNGTTAGQLTQVKLTKFTLGDDLTVVTYHGNIGLNYNANA